MPTSVPASADRSTTGCSRNGYTVLFEHRCWSNGHHRLVAKCMADPRGANRCLAGRIPGQLAGVKRAAAPKSRGVSHAIWLRQVGEPFALTQSTGDTADGRRGRSGQGCRGPRGPERPALIDAEFLPGPIECGPRLPALPSGRIGVHEMATAPRTPQPGRFAYPGEPMVASDERTPPLRRLRSPRPGLR